MKDECIVELSKESLCDRLWLVIIQIEVVIVFTVASCGLQTENNTKVKCNILLLAYVVIDGSVCVYVCVYVYVYVCVCSYTYL